MLLHFGLNLLDYLKVLSSIRRRQRKMVYVTLVTRCKLHVCKLNNNYQGNFYLVCVTTLCLCCTVSQSEKVKQLLKMTLYLRHITIVIRSLSIGRKSAWEFNVGRGQTFVYLTRLVNFIPNKRKQMPVVLKWIIFYVPKMTYSITFVR